jgi:WD40 repeat protein
LYKIEFGPIRATRLHGSDGLASIYGIAASSTKIVVSAGYFTNGAVSRCGLYELMLSSGDVHQIVGNSDCEYSSSWDSISLSPDSRRIIAVRKHRLELIDTETKAVQSLGDGFFYAAWSPNGRWIAALGDNGDHTVLFDAVTLDKRKTLPSTAVIWSPDSHAILASRGHWYCGPDLATLQLIDIETGRSSTIRSSTCKISELVTAWINVPRQ